MLAGSGEKRPPTKAAMLDGLCRRLKPRRGQPLIDVGGGVQLAYFLEQPVLLGTVRELGDLRFQPGLLGCNSIFKCMGNGSATLHDTTSCLRVLAVGFAGASPGDLFRSEHSRIVRCQINLERPGARQYP